MELVLLVEVEEWWEYLQPERSMKRNNYMNRMVRIGKV